MFSIRIRFPCSFSRRREERAKRVAENQAVKQREEEERKRRAQGQWVHEEQVKRITQKKAKEMEERNRKHKEVCGEKRGTNVLYSVVSFPDPEGSGHETMYNVQCWVQAFNSARGNIVSAPDPNQPQHGSLPAIHAGVGLGLGPRLGETMCSTVLGISLKFSERQVWLDASLSIQ